MAHPVFAKDRVALITGSAGGIGLAMAKRCASLGMKVFLCDVVAADLERAQAVVTEAAGGDASRVASKIVDVSDYDQMEAMKQEVFAKFGEVGFLHVNAGISGSFENRHPFEKRDQWQRILNVNLWGVINATQAFTQSMIDQGTPCLIAVTGSKQGITCPPGNTAYNVSKAGVKALTEGLAHQLRNTENCKVSTALLVPGWVNTELQRRSKDAEAGAPVADADLMFSESKPAADAWMPDQVVDYFFTKLAEGSFYIICPDNDVTAEVDLKRMQWSAMDIPLGRPPLSRWHPEHKEAFAAFMESDL